MTANICLTNFIEEPGNIIPYFIQIMFPFPNGYFYSGLLKEISVVCKQTSFKILN